MNLKIVAGKKPKCDICGKDVVEYNPFAVTHYHDKCLAKSIARRIAKQFENRLKNGKK